MPRIGYAQRIKTVLEQETKSSADFYCGLDNFRNSYFIKNNVFVKINEVIIDKKKFYLISKTTNYTEHNYSYTSDYYVTEIEGKEFSIVTIYDNEIDRQKIEKSITESTFR